MAWRTATVRAVAHHPATRGWLSAGPDQFRDDTMSIEAIEQNIPKKLIFGEEKKMLASEPFAGASRVKHLAPYLPALIILGFGAEFAISEKQASKSSSSHGCRSHLGIETSDRLPNTLTVCNRISSGLDMRKVLIAVFVGQSYVPRAHE